jgi:hypothetical protein
MPSIILPPWRDDMNRLKLECKALKSEFGWKRILDSLLGGFVFSTLLFIPLFLILGELIVVFMYLKYPLFLLVTLAAMGYIASICKMTYQALKMKLPGYVSHARVVMQFFAVIGMGFVLIAGLIFVIFLIPILWV